MAVKNITSFISFHLGLADECLFSVVAICHTIEEPFQTQHTNDTVSMGDVGICKQPQLDFTPVDIFNEFPELRLFMKNVLERKGVVHFTIVLHRINPVVTDETLDGQAVGLIIGLVKVLGIFRQQFYG